MQKTVETIFLLLFLLLALPLYAEHNRILEPVTLQLQWKDQFEFAGFYAAKEKGYYEASGLDVHFKPYDKNISIVDEVLKGKAEYGVAYADIIHRYLKGAPLLFLANFCKQSPLVLITQPDILNPGDLRKKRIMADSNSFMLATLQIMLKKFGIEKSDFTIVPPSFSMEPFETRQVDAATIFLSNEIFYLNKQGVAYNILNPAVYGIPSYDLNLFTTQEELKNHPRRVAAFRDASIKGWRYALSHKNEIIRLILRKYNTQHKSYEALRFEAEQLEDMILPTVYTLGSIDTQQVKRIAETMMEAGLLEENSSLDFSDFIYKTPPKHLKLTPAELSHLMRTPDITYCADPDWMPFSSIIHGKHRGIDADMIAYFAQKLNHNFHLIPTKNWTETLQKGKEHNCSVLSMIMETPQRKRYFNFTKPFISIPIVMATTVDKKFTTDFSTLEKKPIGMVEGYAIREFLDHRYPDFNFVSVPNVTEGLKMVSEGKLYGFIDNFIVLSYQIQKHYVGTLKISANIEDQKAAFGFAVRKDDPLLLSTLNKTIDTLDEDTKRHIVNRWTKTIFRDKTPDYDTLWKVLFGFGVILLPILYHYRKIHHYNKKLLYFSTHDALSGLYNRRYIDGKIREQKAPCVLVLIDIDSFKQINDTFGHSCGDAVIKEIAALLENATPPKTYISRWGGEEFLILCNSDDIDFIARQAERMRAMIARTDFGIDRAVTASFGVARYLPEEIHDTTYVQKVDQALYRAKRVGKNRVVVYSEEA